MADDYILDMNGNKHYNDGHVELGPMEQQLFHTWPNESPLGNVGAILGGFRGAGSTWKVDPDVLEATADATTQKIHEYEQALDNMKNLLEQTQGYWDGDSAGAFRSVFKEEYNIVADALATYKEYPTRLLEDAGIYRNTESKAESLASAINSLSLF